MIICKNRTLFAVLVVYNFKILYEIDRYSMVCGELIDRFYTKILFRIVDKYQFN